MASTLANIKILKKYIMTTRYTLRYSLQWSNIITFEAKKWFLVTWGGKTYFFKISCDPKILIKIADASYCPKYPSCPWPVPCPWNICNPSSSTAIPCTLHTHSYQARPARMLPPPAPEDEAYLVSLRPRGCSRSVFIVFSDLSQL